MGEEITVLPSGVSYKISNRLAYDWPSIRSLYEKGVPAKVIAKAYKGISTSAICKKASAECWITPAKEKRMQRELLERQRQNFTRSGVAPEAENVLEDIWKERMERVNQKAFAIAEEAIDAVDESKAKDLIKDTKDLKTMIDVVGKVTGQDKRDADDANKGPSTVVNVGYLRSTTDHDVAYDV